MKIYIAGKVTGLDYQSTIDKFERIKKDIESLGHKVINPMEHVPKGLSWNKSMKKCLPLICKSDGIYLIYDWQQSDGARFELDVANRLGLNIFYTYLDIPKNERRK